MTIHLGRLNKVELRDFFDIHPDIIFVILQFYFCLLKEVNYLIIHLYS